MFALDFFEYVPELSGDDVKVAVALVYRATLNPPQRLTLPELARLAGLGTRSTHTALMSLKDVGLIHYEGDVGPKEDIRLERRLVDPLVAPIAFSWQDTDNKRLADMEQWLRQLAKSKYLSGEHSNLYTELKGDAKALVGEIENDYGRPLNTMEAYTLGRMTREWDVNRIKNVWRKASGRNRIVSTIAILRRGGAGKGATVETPEFKEIKMRQL